MVNGYLSINPDSLVQAGFTQPEIQAFKFVYSNNGKFTLNALQSYGYTYEQAKRLHYMYRICTGQVQIESQDQMSRHLKTMFGSSHKMNISDLAISKITNVPRVAVVSNIDQEPYSIWNSTNYSGNKALYKVIDATAGHITVETEIKPKLKFGQAKKIPGVLEIKGIKANGNVVVTFNSEYATLCNRFIIVASFKNPEKHLGKWEIMCYEGRKIYIYALNMGTRDKVSYSQGNQRVYAYGLYPSDIKRKLDKVASDMYIYVKGVTYNYIPPTVRYNVIDSKKSSVSDESNVEF